MEKIIEERYWTWNDAYWHSVSYRYDKAKKIVGEVIAEYDRNDLINNDTVQHMIFVGRPGYGNR